MQAGRGWVESMELGVDYYSMGVANLEEQSMAYSVKSSIPNIMTLEMGRCRTTSVRDLSWRKDATDFPMMAKEGESTRERHTYRNGRARYLKSLFDGSGHDADLADLAFETAQPHLLYQSGDQDK